MHGQTLARPDADDGSVATFVLLGLIPLIAVLVLVVDVGLLLTARTQLQNAADAAALAAMGTMRDGGRFADAVREANRYAGLQPVLDGGVALAAPDVVLGTFDHATRRFTPGNGSGSAAIRAVARRGAGAPSGPIGLVFAGVLGRGTADVGAEAVASVRRRDLVIVQDRTVSFIDSFEAALAGDRALIRAMADQGFPGDRVGLVSFARDVTEEAPLTALDGGGESYLLSQVDEMRVCRSGGSPGGPCYGTDTGIGIDRARRMLLEQALPGDVERVMVVVSDGVPCLLEYGGWTAVTRGQGVATAEANEAGAAGINLFVITLDQAEAGSPCLSADVAFNESLVRGYGGAVATTDPQKLDDFLVSILRRMPLYLVQ
jgi:hypothetical protein